MARFATIVASKVARSLLSCTVRGPRRPAQGDTADAAPRRFPADPKPSHRRDRAAADRADHWRLLRHHGAAPAGQRGAGQLPPGAALHLCRAAARGAPARQRAAAPRVGAGRPGGHLVAQQRRMGTDAAGHRRSRAGAGQHQPGLPHGRGGIRAQQGGLSPAGDHGALQDQRLPGHAARAGARVGARPAGRAGGPAPAASLDRGVD
jgi:hypothetical protein